MTVSVKSTFDNLSDADILPFAFEKGQGLFLREEQHKLIKQFKQTVSNQLNILRLALNATTVVLLWNDADKDRVLTYAFSSQNKNVLTGPFHKGEGILGAMKGRSDLSLANYSPSAPALPYYEADVVVGSFYALGIEADTGRQALAPGILCVDHTTATEWTDTQHLLLQQSVEQIRSIYALTSNSLYVDYERQTLQQVFNSLQTLNGALDSESVFASAEAAISFIIKTDLLVIGSVHDEMFHLDFVSQPEYSDWLKKQFPLKDSIVGQVVKYRRPMPESTLSPKGTQVINGLSIFHQYGSLLVLPLSLDEGPVSGVLIVTTLQHNGLLRSRRELLEMVCAQLAIKLDLASAHDQISQMSMRDSLTGIANRRAFERGLSAMHERMLRAGTHYSLILCDIDHFKNVNDTYGHPFGDQVIIQVAKQLNHVVRTVDLASRIGGEEFAILLEGTGQKGAYEVAERLRRNVEELKLQFQQDWFKVTISLGIATFAEGADDGDQLLNYADKALYHAKKSGRNCSMIWSSAIETE